MAAIVAQDEQPISRTYQYRKVMKPMLERKRRARINRCLDELKELLISSLQGEGESVSRLEKADVLELTVRHLHKLRRSQQLSESSASDRFRAGFVHCANEVSKYITTISTNSLDISISSRLVSHLDSIIHQIEQTNALTQSVTSTQFSPPLPHPPSILTSYTPPTSPVGSSPKNYSVSPSDSLSPNPALPYQYSAAAFSQLNQISAGRRNQISSVMQPLSLTTKNSGFSLQHHHHLQHQMQQEPFDLSNNENVWRPW